MRRLTYGASILPSDVVLLLHCYDETQRKNKDVTAEDVEENMSRSMISVSSFLKEDTNEMGGRVMHDSEQRHGLGGHTRRASTFSVRRT